MEWFHQEKDINAPLIQLPHTVHQVCTNKRGLEPE